MLWALLASAIAGAAVARLVRLPMWALIGAICGAAAWHLSTGQPEAVPDSWALLAQLLIGAAIGSRLNASLLREFRSVLLPGVAAILSIVAVGVLLAWLLVLTREFDPVVAFFGMIPGGAAEMVSGAVGVGGDGPLIASLHVLRLLGVLSALPVLLWLMRRLGPRRCEEDSPEE